MAHNIEQMLMFKSGLWLIVFSMHMVNANTLPNGTEYDLLKILFRNHNRHARPVYDPGRHSKVYISTILNAILDVNEKGQAFQIRAWFNISWHNEFLVWNTSRFSHIPSLMVDPDMVWLPDLCIYNSRTNHNDIMPDKTRVILHSDGQVVWAPGGVYTVSCAIRVHRFPFDHQHCYIRVSQWYNFNSNRQIEQTRSNAVEIFPNDYQENTEWQIKNTKAHCRNGMVFKDNYADCWFSITMQRRAQYYVIHIVIPAFVLSYLLGFSFLIPHTSGEKLSFVVTLFLAFSLVIDQFDHQLPATSLEICYFSILTKCQYFTGAVQTCVTVLIVHLSKKTNDRTNGTLYRILKSIVNQKELPKESTIPDDSGPDVTKSNAFELKITGEEVKSVGTIGKEKEYRNKASEVTWEHIACAINRTWFYMSLLTNTLAFVIVFTLIYFS